MGLPILTMQRYEDISMWQQKCSKKLHIFFGWTVLMIGAMLHYFNR